MKAFKTNLTNLKSLINQYLPDVPDIYNYPGVSRESLCVAIDTARTLSEEIKPGDEALFAVISLKRAGRSTYEKLKNILETSSEEKKRKHFDEFLDSLAYLLEKTKLTYFIVAKDGLRADSEIAKIRSRIDALAPLESELSAKVSSFSEETGNFKTAIDELTVAHEVAQKQISDLTSWHGTATILFSGLETVHKKVATWDEEIGTNAEEYANLKSKITALANEATVLHSSLNKFVDKASSDSDFFVAVKAQHADILKEINLLLEDANRAGMASAFLKRKKELQVQQYVWQGAFAVAIIGLLVVVGRYLLPSFEKGVSIEVVAELALVSPLVWLGWFAAKQYGYTARIQEDYAFKAAAAMSYEGHKSAAREVDKELEGVLLEFSLYNLAQNPIRLYGRDVHATPWSEFFGKTLSKLCRLGNVKVEASKVGGLEVSFESEEGKGGAVSGK